MEVIENRMLIDSEWYYSEHPIECEEKAKLQGPGYESIRGGIFVPEEDAYDYALERIFHDEELKKEFVNWFFDWDWIKKNE